MLYHLIRPLLFALDAEVSHDLTLNMLRLLHRIGCFSTEKTNFENRINCFGLAFPNPIGLAAGLDKNAVCLPAWHSFGFGFIEVGTVTPKPQRGNSKPRLFRLPGNQAIINRMGFNNNGIDALVKQIKDHAHWSILGVNIGKNKDTSLTDAPKDYLECYEKAYPYTDYVTVNVSSPNTVGLRALQHGEMLKNILLPLKNAQDALSDKFAKKVPILVKLSPDLELHELQQTIEDLVRYKIDGVIITNTTIMRPNLIKERYSEEEGGLSGKPLFEHSTNIVKIIYRQVGDDLPIIAVGGIFTAQDAKEKLAVGAKLVQLYTGFIYRGPKLIHEILAGLH